MELSPKDAVHRVIGVYGRVDRFVVGVAIRPDSVAAKIFDVTLRFEDGSGSVLECDLALELEA